jgi:hypothetical protein
MDDGAIIVSYRHQEPARGMGGFVFNGCLYVLFSCMGLWFVFFALLDLMAGDFKGAGALLFVAAFPLGAMALSLWEQRVRKRYWEKMADQPESWRITRELLSCELGDGGALLRYDFPWARMERILEHKDGFVVGANTWEDPWLPFAGFADAGQVEEFRRMALTAGVKISKRPGNRSARRPS